MIMNALSSLSVLGLMFDIVGVAIIAFGLTAAKKYAQSAGARRISMPSRWRKSGC